eukprot:61789_1
MLFKINFNYGLMWKVYITDFISVLHTAITQAKDVIYLTRLLTDPLFINKLSTVFSFNNTDLNQDQIFDVRMALLQYIWKESKDCTYLTDITSFNDAYKSILETALSIFDYYAPKRLRDERILKLFVSNHYNGHIMVGEIMMNLFKNKRCLHLSGHSVKFAKILSLCISTLSTILNIEQFKNNDDVIKPCTKFIFDLLFTNNTFIAALKHGGDENDGTLTLILRCLLSIPNKLIIDHILLYLNKPQTETSAEYISDTKMCSVQTVQISNPQNSFVPRAIVHSKIVRNAFLGNELCQEEMRYYNSVYHIFGQSNTCIDDVVVIEKK